MKKLLVICCALVVVATSFAQEQKHYFEVSVAEPVSSLFWLNNTLPTRRTSEWKLEESWSDEVNYRNAWFCPPVTVGYYYQVLDWLQVGGEVGTFVNCTKPGFFAETDNSGKYLVNSSLFLTAGVRFNYYHKNIVDLYSGLNLGVNVKMYATEASPMALCTARSAWQLTALGVRFGRRVYGVFEIGYGYKGFLSMGIGTRF